MIIGSKTRTSFMKRYKKKEPQIASINGYHEEGRLN